jgi:hypothetical protein
MPEQPRPLTARPLRDRVAGARARALTAVFYRRIEVQGACRKRDRSWSWPITPTR